MKLNRIHIVALLILVVLFFVCAVTLGFDVAMLLVLPLAVVLELTLLFFKTMKAR